VTEWIRTFLPLDFVVRRSMSENFGAHWDSDMGSYLECGSSGSTTGFATRLSTHVDIILGIEKAGHILVS
jgi:hypothetical protein